MKCPLNQIQLISAKFSLNTTLEKNFPGEEGDEELQRLVIELQDKFSYLIAIDGDPKEEKRNVAEYHGISIEQLINSPNYSQFVKEWKENNTKLVMKAIQEALSLTDEETWVFMAMIQESI
jgi:hypothetical protein